MENTNTPSPESKEETNEPAPEVLAPRQDDSAGEAPDPKKPADKPAVVKRRHTYRPSHKATFVSLAVIVAVLVINAGIVAFVLKRQSGGGSLGSQGEVTISQGVLDKIGVNRNTIGPEGLELIVSPNARFNGEVKVGGSVSIAKELKINSKFTASEAALTQLEAGKTALGELNVNGDTTVSNLNLRNNLQVTGSTRLQGPVTLSQLLTVNNHVSVAGNLSIGGALSTNALSVRTLTVTSNITLGGHIITSGQVPGVSAGPGVGSNGSVSISGNDASGTVAVNTGVGASGGNIANVTFRSRYGTMPHVVITPVGANVGSFYISRSTTGFSIHTAGGLAPGGYAFDYIVMQ